MRRHDPVARGGGRVPGRSPRGARRAAARWRATRRSSCTRAASRSPLTSVEAFAGRVPGVEPGAPRPTVYGRRAGPWLQYWLLLRATTRRTAACCGPGATRATGRWSSTACARGRLVRAVYAQHSGAESCGYGAGPARPAAARSSSSRAGSHAAYFRPGLRDRTWPDPNDEADGRGRARPAAARAGHARSAPPWMRYAGRWGATRAGWVPGEMDSPRGPAFQPQGRWSDPDGWARGGAAVHAARLRRARRVRRARDRDRGRARGPGDAARALGGDAADAPRRAPLGVTAAASRSATT